MSVAIVFSFVKLAGDSQVPIYLKKSKDRIVVLLRVGNDHTLLGDKKTLVLDGFLKNRQVLFYFIAESYLENFPGPLDKKLTRLKKVKKARAPPQSLIDSEIKNC